MEAAKKQSTPEGVTPIRADHADPARAPVPESQSLPLDSFSRRAESRI
jgi:hypothetical protein